MCYYIIQNFIETIIIYVILLPGSTSKDLGGGASVYLTLALLRLLIASVPRNAVRLDFHHVTVSHGHGASPSVRSNARLSVALRDRPGHEKRDRSESLRGPRRLRAAASRYRTHSSRGFILCSFYIALRSHARELENSRVYIYVVSTLSRTLRKRGTHFVSILCT